MIGGLLPSAGSVEHDGLLRSTLISVQIENCTLTDTPFSLDEAPLLSMFSVVMT